jgi:RNA polymerase sigma factor (sigma-70 family)
VLEGPQWFATTHWSVILCAAQRETPEATAALEQLCRSYWFPLYGYARRRGYNVQDAQDLTQEFFAALLGKNRLVNVSPYKGRFRSFLLASFNHFLADAHDRRTCLKRGGNCELVSIEAQEAEDRYKLEPVDHRTPESLYDRQWALALLERVLERLRQELIAAGKGKLFEELQGFLLGERGGARQVELAARLGLTQSAVAVTVHRLRHRYQALLREELSRTVADPREVDEEMKELFTALRR